MLPQWEFDDTTAMFARFRQSRDRLNVSIHEARRVNGKVKQDHIANIGSVETPPSARSRIGFWQQFDERMPGLSNRISADDVTKIRNAIADRIPTPTEDEIAANSDAAHNEELAAWDEVRSGWDDASKMLDEKVAMLEENLAREKPMVAITKSLASDIDSIKSNIASGKISAEQSARLRGQTRIQQISLFLGIGGIRTKKRNEEQIDAANKEWADGWYNAIKK
jgi:hypothetical protein